MSSLYIMQVEINPFRYRSYYYDEETGLFYTNTRYYDLETGRFISADDIAYLNPESINGLNLYAYCLNNPIAYIDPTGNFPVLAVLLGAVVGGAVGYGIGRATGVTGLGLVALTLGFAIIGGIASYYIGSALATKGTAVSANALENAKFAQTTYSQNFSPDGIRAFEKMLNVKIKTVGDFTNAISSGVIDPTKIPINYIIREGNALILNTRSAMALTNAGVPRTIWYAVNQTGVVQFENMLTAQLLRNGLTSKGIAFVILK